MTYRAQTLAVGVVAVLVGLFLALLSMPHADVLECARRADRRVACTKWQESRTPWLPFRLAESNLDVDASTAARVASVEDEGGRIYRVELVTAGRSEVFGLSHADPSVPKAQVAALVRFLSSESEPHLYLEDQAFAGLGLVFAALSLATGLALLGGLFPPQGYRRPALMSSSSSPAARWPERQAPSM